MTAIVTVDRLTYEYPGVRALDSISFDLPRGSVTALVGPNGAGKSTLLRCMAALDQPLDGRIEIEGVDVLEHPRECHRRIGYLSDFFGLYDSLTVQQNLTYAAWSQGISAEATEKATRITARRLNLTEKLTERCSNLSRGQRQRVAIAKALIHQPALLILDEPASGLDPEARHELAAVFKQLSADGITLIVSSHILAELDEYSTHILVIRDGKIIEHRPLNNTATAENVCQVRVVFATANNQQQATIEAALQPFNDVRLHSCTENEAIITLPATSTDKAVLLRTLVQAGLEVIAFSDNKENLHASYLRTLKS